MEPARVQPERLTARDRLLDAAESVVAREGVVSLTLDAVAREAGVSKGGLLYHFPSKSSLIIAVVERLAARCESDQDQALALEEEAAGAFTRAYVTSRTTLPKPEEKPVHTALLVAAGSDPQYLEPIRVRLREWQARLESDGIDPAMATVIRLAVDGLCIGGLLGLPVPEGDFRQKVLDKLLGMTSKE